MVMQHAQSKWVPDADLVPWDVTQDEKALPCKNCFGRGTSRQRPRLCDLKLPWPMKSGPQSGLDRSELFRKHVEKGNTPVVGAGRVGKGRAQVLRERALRLKSDRTVGTASPSSEDSLSVCSDSVLPRPRSLQPWSQVSTPAASIAGEMPEEFASSHFDDKGEDPAFLELCSNSSSSSQESLPAGGFGVPSDYYSRGSKERGYAFNVSYSNMNRNTGKFDSMELGDFLPTQLPLHAAAGGFGKPGSKPSWNVKKSTLNVKSVEEFPVLGAAAAVPVFSSAPAPQQNEVVASNSNHGNMSMKAIANMVNNDTAGFCTNETTDQKPAATEQQSSCEVPTSPEEAGNVHKLAIKGLPAGTTQEALVSRVADYGEIVSCQLTEEGGSCGAIISMGSESACDWVIECLNGSEDLPGEGSMTCQRV